MRYLGSAFLYILFVGTLLLTFAVHFFFACIAIFVFPLNMEKKSLDLATVNKTFTKLFNTLF